MVFPDTSFTHTHELWRIADNTEQDGRTLRSRECTEHLGVSSPPPYNDAWHTRDIDS